MSHKTVRIVIAVYFFIALAFATVMGATDPLTLSQSYPLVARTSNVLGMAGGVFVASGLIPIIIWAFKRFRAADAFIPLFIWSALLGIIVLFEGIETFRDRERQDRRDRDRDFQYVRRRL